MLALLVLLDEVSVLTKKLLEFLRERGLCVRFRVIMDLVREHHLTELQL